MEDRQKKENNGVLILLVLDQREIVFETGTGIQQKLTDDICYEIQQEWMIPLLRENQYSEGLVKGVDGVINYLKTNSTGKSQKTETVAEKPVEEKADEEQERELLTKGNIEFMTYFWGIPGIFVLLYIFSVVARNRKISDVNEKHAKIVKATKNAHVFLLLAFLNVPVIVITALFQIFYSKFLTKYPMTCPNCGHWQCKLVPNDAVERALDPKEKYEVSIGACQYVVTKCSNCKADSKIAVVNPEFTYCPTCESNTAKETSSKVLIKPSTTSCGKRQATFTCFTCNKEVEKELLVEMVKPVYIAPQTSYSSGSSYSGDGYSSGFMDGYRDSERRNYYNDRDSYRSSNNDRPSTSSRTSSSVSISSPSRSSDSGSSSRSSSSSSSSRSSSSSSSSSSRGGGSSSGGGAKSGF